MSTEPFRLDGRTAIVTGAGSGIGQAIALRMAGAGASVVCADIVPELAEETVEAIRSEGGTARSAIVDVSKRDQVDELVASVPELDVMCNNAGIINHFHVVDVTEAELDRIFAVNLKGVLFGCQAAARSMVTARSGKHHQHVLGRGRYAGADHPVLRHGEGGREPAHQDPGH